MKLLTLCLLLAMVGACSRTEQWVLTYRTQAKSTPWQYADIAGYYESAEQCQTKGAGLLRLGNNKGQFQCGQQCEAENGQLSCAVILPSSSSSAVRQTP